MYKNKRIITIICLLFSLIILSCNLTSGITSGGSSLGKVEGVLLQEAKNISMSGTVRLIPEKYLTETPDPAVTLEPSEYTLVDIGKDSTFSFKDVQPGRYYLDVSVVLIPCFLGAPGQVFNGMIVSFMDNWSPLGLSLKDGSSVITGKTEAYEIAAGKTIDVKLQLPKCYKR